VHRHGREVRETRGRGRERRRHGDGLDARGDEISPRLRRVLYTGPHTTP
jgi:hypothetical protein